MRKIERNVIEEFSEFEKGKKFLDVGCGGGYYALRAKSAGMHVTAIDTSLKAIQQLEDKVDHALVGDVETLSLNQTFSRVLCAGVLDFVIRPQIALWNLFRLTKPGGKVVILAPREGLGGQLYRLEKRVIGFDSNLFTVKWICDIASIYNMKMVRYCYPLPHNLAILFIKM